MICACQIAKEKGFKIVSQQIRVNNIASIALHSSLGFETNGVPLTNAKGKQVFIYLKSLV
jgi:L-amino acid N-acyltransferase YncA